ncbi:MAG: LytR family transcriptional regulator [Nocardioidaceae bacterium]|nr:LytR family transcriptional regulator [Nocardioidaceae bacterium]
MEESTLPWRRRHRLAWRGLCAVLVLTLLLVGTALVLQQRLVGHLGRIDGAFNGLSDRPGVPAGRAGRAVNIVVLTVDDAATPVTPAGVPAPDWVPRARHVDALTLLHIDGDRRGASSTAVPLTAVGDAVSDDPALLVTSIEQLTSIRVDHLMAMDWSGLSSLVDNAGGIPVDVNGQGRTTMDGTQVTAFVGQRDGLSDPTLDPLLRFQAVMRELMDDTLHTAFRKHPFALYGVLDTISRSLSVDRGWTATSMRGLGFSLRDLRSAGIDYLVVPTVPAAGTTVLDPALGPAFWTAVREDRVEAWVAEHPAVRVAPAVD